MKTRNLPMKGALYRNLKSILQNLFLLTGVLFLCFLFLEVGLRLLVSLPPHERPPTSFWQPHPSLGWSLIPNKEGRWENQEFSNLIRINSAGFRDLEYSLEKPEGVFRIIVLGDSMTEGLQVPLEQTFAKILETLLNGDMVKDNPSKKKFEVLNLGVAAYGTGQEYLLLKEYGLRYQPDLVILAFLSLNDVLNNSLKLEKSMAGTEWERAYRPYFIPDGNGDLKLIPPRAIRIPFWENLYTYRFILQKIRTAPGLRRWFLPQHTERDFWGLYNPRLTPEWREAWDITQKLILKIKKEAGDHHAGFLLVSLTNRDSFIDGTFADQLKRYASVNWDIDKPDKILEDFCQEHSIPFLALTPLFRDYLKKADRPIQFHYASDGHWNVEGHRLAAEFIYKKLKEMEVVQKSLDNSN